MAHFIFGFLHELADFDGLPADDAGVYAKWLGKLANRTFDAKLDIWRPLVVVSQENRVHSFSPADDIDADFAKCLDVIWGSSGGSWTTALRAATVMVAEELHLYGAAGALGEPNDANERLRNTPHDILVRDILHEVPERIAAHYQSCVDRPCCGRPAGNDDMRDFQRENLACLYECFLRSYLPPFTHNTMGLHPSYRFLDIREAAFRRECEQGEASSRHGDVVITFAHVNE